MTDYEKLRDVALKAAGRFRYYEKQHKEKLTNGSLAHADPAVEATRRDDILRKAAANKAMAREIEGVLGVGPQPALVNIDSTSEPQ